MIPPVLVAVLVAVLVVGGIAGCSEKFAFDAAGCT